MSRMKEFCEAVQKAIADENYYAALIVALTLPDIAGWIETPTAGSGKRYADWFSKFVEPKYTINNGAHTRCHLNGADCYALRCSVLHEGRDETAAQRAHDALERFQFVVPDPGHTVHNNKVNKKLQLQLDFFCRDICDGIENWLRTISGDVIKEKRIEDLVFIQVGGDIVVTH